MSSARRPTRFEVYVQPRASTTQIAGLHGGIVRIRVAAPPVEDAANRALIEFLAARLGIPRRSVRIASGATTRRKVLEIDGRTPEEVAGALKAGG